MENNVNVYPLYPLTIVKDRYTGVYSGGIWTAWNCNPDDVPNDIYADDVACCGFWSTALYSKAVRVSTFISCMRHEDIDDFESPVFGVGNTIEDAIRDLKKRLNIE